MNSQESTSTPEDSSDPRAQEVRRQINAMSGGKRGLGAMFAWFKTRNLRRRLRALDRRLPRHAFYSAIYGPLQKSLL